MRNPISHPARQAWLVSTFRIAAILAACLSQSARAQSIYAPYTFSSFAGSGVGENVATGMAVDSQGEVFVASSLSGGGITKVATDGSNSFIPVGPNTPQGLAVDSVGNLYTMEPVSSSVDTIVEIPAGSTTVNTIATYPTQGCNALTVDHSGNIYVAAANRTLVKIVSGSPVILAGSPNMQANQDGTGSQAQFGFMTGLTTDAAGNIYAVDEIWENIRKITPSGVVTTLTGFSLEGTQPVDGPLAVATFASVISIASDSGGNLFVTDGKTVRRISPAGQVNTIAGVYDGSGDANGIGSAVYFNLPLYIGTDSNGFVYVCDFGNNDIRKGYLTPPPQITSQPSSDSIYAGQSFSFRTASSGIPQPTYQWYFDGNPIGGATSSIYTIDNPQAADSGSYYVVASNASGSAQSDTATLSVTAAPVPPSFLAQPSDATANAGASATFWVTTSGSPAPTLQWYFNGAAISGATGSMLTVSNLSASSAGSYTVSATNTGGTVTSSPAKLSLNAAGSAAPPAIAQQPASQTVASGATVVFSIGADSTLTATSSGTSLVPLSVGSTHQATRTVSASTYQWFLNGTALAGATDSILVISSTSSSNSGSYSCLVTNPGGSVLTNSATLNVVQTSDPGRLINISCRASAGTGDGVLIVGFVVGGQGTQGAEPLLVRASGPALAQFGVSGALPDPKLQLMETGSTLVSSNDGWAGNVGVSSTAASVGAFAWTNPSSHDSALVESLQPAAYTALVSGESADTGIALAEVYDATGAGTYTSVSPRLINISARVHVGTGSGVLIAGFVIGGSTSKTVLIRASGPALTPFGVSGVLPDPKLQLTQGSGASAVVLGTNAGWGGDSLIATTAASVGAFSWGTTATKDSALLVTLPPGAYTAQVVGAGGDTGIALVEVYDVQ